MAEPSVRRRICRTVILLFVLAYLAALIVLGSGLQGWFGMEGDALAGVYVIVLGQPWVGFIDHAPERAWPYLATLAPLVNLLLIAGICRLLGRRPPAP